MSGTRLLTCVGVALLLVAFSSKSLEAQNVGPGTYTLCELVGNGGTGSITFTDGNITDFATVTYTQGGTTTITTLAYTDTTNGYSHWTNGKKKLTTYKWGNDIFYWIDCIGEDGKETMLSCGKLKKEKKDQDEKEVGGGD